MKTKMITIGTMLLALAVMMMAFSVQVFADEKTVSTDKTVYTEGEPILVTATGDNADWVGIYLVDDVIPDDTSIVWYYVARDGNTSGTAKDLSEDVRVERADLAEFPAGDYVIYLFENDGYTILAQQAITVEVASTEPDPELPPAGDGGENNDDENDDQTGTPGDDENNDDENNDQTGTPGDDENNDDENNDQTGSTDDEENNDDESDSTPPQTGDYDMAIMIVSLVALAGVCVVLGRKQLCK